MVSKFLLLSGLIVASSPLLANAGCTKGSEYEPPLCPIKLPKIVAVHIEENAARAVASKDSEIDCSTFGINAKTVRRFLSRAKEANESDAHHTLDWSPCYASGTATLADGRKAHWSINQAQTGSFYIDGDRRIFLYCPSCKFRPFLY
jgi:hypothetical protein